MTKREWRRHFKRLRQTVEPAARSQLEGQLTSVASQLPLFSQFCVVAGYAAHGHELAIDALLVALTGNGVRVLLPRVHPTRAEMVFCEVNSPLDSLPLDRFGIRTPDGKPYTGTFDVMFVPGLGFGRDGSRIGFGAGFYDRYLDESRETSGLVCGVGFTNQLVDTLPTQPHDAFLDFVLTPTSLTRCRRD